MWRNFLPSDFDLSVCESLGHAEGRPKASCLREVMAYLKDMGSRTTCSLNSSGFVVTLTSFSEFPSVQTSCSKRIMRSLARILLVSINVEVITTTSSHSAVYRVEYCRNNVSAYETYTNISRAECALRCLNYTGCFGVSMTDLTESSGIVATCQLEPFRSVNFGQLCQYNAGSLNYYRTDECARCGFTKYGSKCYKSVTTVTDIPSKIDAECRRKYNGSRAVLPRSQEDLDEMFGFLKFI